MSSSANADLAVPYTPLPPNTIRILCLEPGASDDLLTGYFTLRQLGSDRTEEDAGTDNSDAGTVDSAAGADGRGRGLDDLGTMDRSNVLDPAQVDEREHPSGAECTEASDYPSDAYEAISYAWGDPGCTHTIRLRGHGVLRITESLYGALHQFRFRSGVRRLWADAVCIRQDDHVEKSAQVAAMATVYSAARRVLVWLGPSAASDALAFQVLGICAVNIAENEDFTRGDGELRGVLEQALKESSTCTCCGTAIEQGTSSLPSAMAALEKLLERAWFGRLWPVQEARLRQDALGVLVRCGKHWMSLAMVRDAAMHLLYNVTSSHSRLSWLQERAFGLPDIGNNPTTLLKDAGGLDYFSLLSCGNPLDRVFAVRAVLGLEELETLIPDYTLSPGDLYYRFSLAVMSANKSSDDVQGYDSHPWVMLSLVGTEDSRLMELSSPSWVPDIHRLSTRSRRKLRLNCSDGKYNLAPFSAAPEEFFYTPSYGSSLKVQGRCFAQVDAIYPHTSYSHGLADSIRAPESDHTATALESWYARCIASASNMYATLHSLRRLKSFLLQHFAVDVSDSGFCGGTALLSTMSLASSSSASFDKDLEWTLASIRGEGYQDLCWVGPSTQTGDKVCILKGAPFPFVLRPMPGDLYQLMGDACTAGTTLSQALGLGGSLHILTCGSLETHSGVGFERPRRLREGIDPNGVNDWNHKDPRVRAAIDSMGWITLV